MGDLIARVIDIQVGDFDVRSVVTEQAHEVVRLQLMRAELDGFHCRGGFHERRRALVGKVFVLQIIYHLLGFLSCQTSPVDDQFRDFEVGFFQGVLSPIGGNSSYLRSPADV